jgi:non-ribosomal peptide synthetase component F
LSPLAQSSESGRYDLTVWVSEAGEEVRVRWTYNTDMFEEERVVRMESHYEQLLESMMREPEGKLSSFQMMSEQERQERVAQRREREESNVKKLRTIGRKAIKAQEPNKDEKDDLNPEEIIFPEEEASMDVAS